MIKLFVLFYLLFSKQKWNNDKEYSHLHIQFVWFLSFCVVYIAAYNSVL